MHAPPPRFVGLGAAWAGPGRSAPPLSPQARWQLPSRAAATEAPAAAAEAVAAVTALNCLAQPTLRRRAPCWRDCPRFRTRTTRSWTSYVPPRTTTPTVSRYHHCHHHCRVGGTAAAAHCQSHRHHFPPHRHVHNERHRLLRWQELRHCSMAGTSTLFWTVSRCFLDLYHALYHASRVVCST